MKPFSRKARETAHLELTSLMDIIFILLIFFMISSSFLKPAIRLKLPVSVTKDKNPKNKVKLSYSKEGILYLNKEEVSEKVLGDKLFELAKKSKDFSVLFYGDESISYKNFIKIMDLIRNSGVKNIAIAHRFKK